MPSLQIPTHSEDNIPQIHFDQLTTIARHHHAARNNLPAVDATTREDNEITHSMILQGIAQGQINPKLTRKLVMQQDDWLEWQSSEFKQLDSYDSLNMFGAPCKPPRDSNILPLIWTYLKKSMWNQKFKMRL